MGTIEIIPQDTLFLDFGCSKGNSLRAFQQKFGGPGIGIDINDKKLAAAKAAGLDARKIDLFVNALPKNCVRFVSMIHVLEHLHSEKQVKIFLKQGISAAREFIIIRIPYFDADGVLAQQGFKFYHSDWHGHPMPLSTLQLFRCIRDVARGKVREFYLAGRQRLKGEVSGIIPIEAPIDTTKQQANGFGTFDVSTLGIRIYKELAAVIVLNANPKLAKWVMGKFKVDPADTILSCRLSDQTRDICVMPNVRKVPAQS